MKRGGLGIIIIALAAALSPMKDAHARLEAESWAIQQTQIRTEEIAQSDADLVVIDITSDGNAANEFEAADLAMMRDNDKQIIASLSVGKAEPWREYWNGQWEEPRQSPCYELRFDTRKREWRRENTCPKGNIGLVGNKDPLWDGELVARYSDPRWYDDVLESYLDKILAAGFDGVYLTNTDVFENRGRSSITKRIYAREMQDLILRVARYARSKAGSDFVIIVEDGDRLLAASKDRGLNKGLLQSIDAIGVKSLLLDTSDTQRQRRISVFQKYVGTKVPIFVSECASKKEVSKLRTWQAQLLTKYGLRTSITWGRNDCLFDSLSHPLD